MKKKRKSSAGIPRLRDTHIVTGRRAPGKAAFLSAFRQSGNVKLSAEIAGVSRTLVYEWNKRDPKFADDFAQALEDAQDTIREAIAEWALRGIEITKIRQQSSPEGLTETIEKETRRSERMLELLAKLRLPEYRDRTEISGPNGAPIEVTDARDKLLGALSRLAAGVEKSDRGAD